MARTVYVKKAPGAEELLSCGCALTVEHHGGRLVTSLCEEAAGFPAEIRVLRELASGRTLLEGRRSREELRANRDMFAIIAQYREHVFGEES